MMMMMMINIFGALSDSINDRIPISSKKSTKRLGVAIGTI